jgi:L-seryl-tRNA(Ser) seleniumtransferase
VLREDESAVGGGCAPTAGIPTVVVAVTHPALGPDRLAAALRAGHRPVVVRVAEDRLVVDLRTVRPDEEQIVLDALVAAGRT